MFQGSELSVLELDAERGELLPEREALQWVNIGNFVIITQVAVNVAVVTGNHDTVTQSITQFQNVDLSQAFRVSF